MTVTTTLADIRAAEPCPEGFAKIRDHFGVSAPDAKNHREPFPVALLLDTNDLDDTLWVLDNVIGSKRLCRLFAADCAERVLHIFERARPGDNCPRNAIAGARDLSSTEEDLAAARAAAGAAAGAAAWEAAREAQSSRLRQYLEHGEEAAADMPWDDKEAAE